MQHGTKTQLVTLTSLLVVSTSSTAYQEEYFLRPAFGISSLSNTYGDTTSIGNTNGKADVEPGNGFNAGLGVGYHYTDQLAIELFWEYRSNESETTIADGTQFTEGNYASNIFFLNGHYNFHSGSNWRPYLGAGLGWVQEIDIDLEANGVELSYSGDGHITYQAFTGIDYRLNSRISINAELRYQALSSVDLVEEGGEGSFSSLDYNPITLQLGLTWRL
jgi:outer membrane protein W